jgi:MscS family membrane protein
LGFTRATIVASRASLSVLQETLFSYLTSPPALVIGTVIAALICGVILARVLRTLWSRIARRTQTDWDDQLVSKLGAPLSALIAVQLFRVALLWLPLGPTASATLHELIGQATILAIVWGAFRGVDIIRSTLEHRTWAVERPASRSLLALGGRFAKVAILIMGALVALSQLGVSVASLIAGLGIGGLVIALAAQKTVENVFGAVSIGIDQPMREGDFVRVYDFVGTVEQIGLRSTRIRTLDRTLITIPNGELANQRIESFTARDRIRLACTIGLEYGTSASQMREGIARLTQILQEHPKIWPDAIVVRFKEFAESSLDIEVMAWFQTSDWSEFQSIRQDVLLSFMDAIEQTGASIAFPTRTLHITRDDIATSTSARLES